jgi:hypothetical protein
VLDAGANAAVATGGDAVLVTNALTIAATRTLNLN